MATWLGGPALVRADPEPIAEPSVTETTVAVADALSLEPGATCLEHDRLSEQVVTWLERDELDPRLTVVVEGDPIEVRSLRFTLRDRGEVIAERAFAPGPSSCDDLHAVVALAIALAVDATVLESVGIGPAVSPPPSVEPRLDAPPEPEPEPVRAVLEPTPTLDLSPRPSRPWTLRAHAHGLLAINAPPTLGGGAAVGIEASWRDRIDLQLGAMATSAAPRAIAEGTLAVTLLAARVDLCAGPQLGRVRPRGCLGALAGNAVAQGRGFDQDGRVVLPWMAVAAGGDVRIAVHRRVALSLGLEGLLSVVQPVFYVRQESQERQLQPLPRVGALLSGGVVIAIGRPFDEGR